MPRHRTMTATHFPPGPPRRFFSLDFLAMRGRPLEFLSGLVRDHGDIVGFRAGRRDVVLLNRPELIQDVLVTHQAKFTKSHALHRARVVLGDGLLTSEGGLHRRQRRLLQPAFHRRRLEAYATVMTESALRFRGQWPEGESRDMAAEMARLTLDVVARTLFSADVEQDAGKVGTALTTLVEGFNLLMLPLAASWPGKAIPAVRRVHAARRELDRLIYKLIHERRASGVDAGDLLSTLVFSEDADHPGEHLSDSEVRDQALTLFLAGHETTANALAWIWYLLVRHPEIEARLHAELAATLGGRPPTLADVPRLSYVMKLVRESLRLYPPAWMIGRQARERHTLAGYDLPAGTIVLASQWIMHRNPEYFPDPEQFNPERWTESFEARLPKFAYFPFGGGARTCIGENFAWMELVLLLSTLAQTWRPQLVPGQNIEPQPRITLRPRHGLRMRVTSRG